MAGATRHTDSNHQNLPWPHHVYHPFRVLEDFQHHFLLSLRRRLVLGVGARVDDAVHVEVQVVHFLAVGVRLGCINGHLGAVGILERLIFDDRGDNLGIFLREPSEKRWDTHVGG